MSAPVAYEVFDQNRPAMLERFGVAVRALDPSDVQAEIDATASAMRQIAEIAGGGNAV